MIKLIKSVLRDRKLSLSMKGLLGDPIETVIRLSNSKNDDNSFHSYITKLHKEKKINLLYQQFKGKIHRISVLMKFSIFYEKLGTRRPS